MPNAMRPMRRRWWSGCRARPAWARRGATRCTARRDAGPSGRGRAAARRGDAHRRAPRPGCARGGGAQARARAHRDSRPQARTGRAGRGRMAQTARPAARRRARRRGRPRLAAPGERAAAGRDRRRGAGERPRRGGARRGNEAPRVPDDPAGRPRGRPPVVAAGRARDRPDGEGHVPRVVRQGARELPRRVPDAVRRRRVRRAARERGRAPRERDRDPRRSARQAHPADSPALVGRAHARRRVALVRDLPGETQPVLSARRGGRAARRRERRPLRAAARRFQGSDAIHIHYAQPPHHAGRGRGLRRHDAGARRVHHRGRATGPDGTGLKRVRRALRGALLLGLAVPAGVAARRLRVSPAAGITPLAPVDPVLTTITPDFSWSLDNPPPPGTTVTYRLRVARDSAFASLVVETATDTAGDGPRRPPQAGGAPVLRAAPRRAATGGTGAKTRPSWAALTTLSGPGGVNTADDQPTFAWRSPAVAAPPGPFRYDLTGRRSGGQFANLPEFAVGGLPDTSYRAPKPLRSEERRVGK